MKPSPAQSAAEEAVRLLRDARKLIIGIYADHDAEQGELRTSDPLIVRQIDHFLAVHDKPPADPARDAEDAAWDRVFEGMVP